jgi:hypothetical protein
VRQAGGRTILELWVPAEELPEFNRHIVGRIEVVHEFRPPRTGSGRAEGSDAGPVTGS